MIIGPAPKSIENLDGMREAILTTDDMPNSANETRNDNVNIEGLFDSVKYSRTLVRNKRRKVSFRNEILTPFMYKRIMMMKKEEAEKSKLELANKTSSK